MSKIHEALKKAQQERESDFRGAAQTATTETARAEVVHPGPMFRPPVAVGSVPAVDRAAAHGDFLRFEDLRERCAKPSWKTDPSAMVFSETNEPRSGAEQFRTLRSRLYRLRDSRPIRSLLVTSALAGEGKTFVACNLAQAIARQRDRRVLLIDGDLRCSTSHKFLGAPPAPGLTDYLCGKAGLAEVIQCGARDDLCFIPGGNPVSDPTELICSDRLRDLFERLAPVFEWIILDSAPAIPVSDTAVLADHCDGVLVVVAAGSTSLDAAERACQEFRERNLIGVVLNRVEREYAYGAYYTYDYDRNGKK